MGQWLFDTIPSKLDVEGSSPFSRSTGPSLGLHELGMALSHGLSMSSSDPNIPSQCCVVSDEIDLGVVEQRVLIEIS
jgi:hypothetical protein